MRLTINRIWRATDYTIGRLSVNGSPFCDTLEDRDRGLESDMPLEDLRRLKLSGKTAIPTGTYDITMKVYSPKFGARAFYRQTCRGKLPRLLNVPAYEGILIHCGNDHRDTAGCILVGWNEVKGRLVRSAEAFRRLCERLTEADSRGEAITITIE